MIYVADTTVLVDNEKGRLGLDRWLKAHSGALLVTTPVTVAELRRLGRTEEKVSSMIESFDLHPITERTGFHWGELALATRHLPRGVNDLWIAAVAREIGAAVLTRDRGFGAIPVPVEFYD